MLYLCESDVLSLLPMEAAISAIEAAAGALGRGEAANVPRQRARTGDAIMHVLPSSYAAADAMGLKVYTTGKGGISFSYLLFDASGELLALVAAERLGQIRTGAASGVATRHMSRLSSRTLAVIGTGFQARSQLEAVCLTRLFERVRVWGRNPANLDAFIAEMRDVTGMRIDAAPSARDAVDGADVAITMTSSPQPVLEGAWLAPGTHVNAAGSNRLHERELDAAVLSRAAIVAVEDVAQARMEAGDLQLAADDGAFAWDRAVTLGAIVAGTAPGRRTEDDITVFESLGIGLWDTAVARYVYDRAVAEGIGTELELGAKA